MTTPSCDFRDVGPIVLSAQSLARSPFHKVLGSLAVVRKPSVKANLDNGNHRVVAYLLLLTVQIAGALVLSGKSCRRLINYCEIPASSFHTLLTTI